MWITKDLVLHILIMENAVPLLLEHYVEVKDKGLLQRN